MNITKQYQIAEIFQNPELTIDGFETTESNAQCLLFHLFCIKTYQTSVTDVVLFGSMKSLQPVADLEGVRGVRLNPPLGPNYFNFMGKFMKNQAKC